jgi:hypothetical protein
MDNALVESFIAEGLFTGRAEIEACLRAKERMVNASLCLIDVENTDIKTLLAHVLSTLSQVRIIAGS